MLRINSRTAVKTTILLALLALLWGCSEGSLLVPDLSGPEDPAVDTVEAGSLLSSDATIPISIPEGSEGRYTRLDIRILSPAGEELYLTTYDSAVLSEPLLPPLPVPDLSPGSYILDLRLYEQEQEVARREALVFVTDVVIELLGITLYPPTSQTEAELLAEATVQIGEGEVDPYIRWRYDGAVVAEGAISDIGETVRIPTGRESGVFTITAELFPWAPSAELSYDFTSPLIHRTDVVVRPPTASQGSAAPWVRYSFDGHLRPDGDPTEAGARGSWTPLGEPELTLEDELFGYLIDGESGFHLSESLLPRSAGELLPFRLELSAALLTAPLGEAPVFATGIGGARLLLGIADDGAFWVDLSTSESRHRSATGPAALTVGELSTLAVEIIPARESTELLLYLEGELLEVDYAPLTLAGSPKEANGSAVGITQFLDSHEQEGSVVQSTGQMVVLLDELLLTRSSHTPERREVVTVTAAAPLEARMPETSGRSVRYRLSSATAAGATVEVTVGDENSRELLGTLSEAVELTLYRRNGAYLYSLGQEEALRLEGRRVYLEYSGDENEIDLIRDIRTP